MTHSGNNQRRLPTTWKQGLPMLVLRGGKRQVTDWIRDVLVHTDYPTLNRGGKETVLRYLEHQSGLSKAMVLRHVLSYCARQRMFGDESAPVGSGTSPVTVTRHSSKLTVATLAAMFLLTGVAGGTWVRNSALQAQLLSTQADVLKLERARIAQVESPTGTVLPAPSYTVNQTYTGTDPERLETLRRTITARIDRLQQRLGRSAAANGITNTSTVASLFELTGKGQDGQILMLLRGRPMWVNMPGSIAADLDPPSRHRPYDPAGGEPRSYGGGNPTSGGTTGGGGSSISLPISINTDTSGVLSQGRGGLGFSSYSSGDLIIGTSAGGLTKLSLGTGGYVLTSSGGTVMWRASTGGGGGTSSGLSLMTGDGRYVNTAGDIMTGALVIQNGNTHAATSTPLLNVRGTMSGRNLYISGTGSSPLLATNIATGRVGIGTSAPKVALEVVGTVSGSTLLAATSIGVGTSNPSGFLQLGSSTTDQSVFQYLNATQTNSVGLIFQTAGSTMWTQFRDGGNRLRFASAVGEVLSLSQNGNIGVGTIIPSVKFQVSGSGAFSSRLAVGGTFAKTPLEVFGTISGSALVINGSITSTGALNVRGAITFRSLTGCTALQTDSNGLLSCGSGGSGTFGSGNVITIGNSRYVSKQGDTMTGALVIQNGNTHTATTTPLLNVRGTMSGRSLYLTGTGARPLLMTNVSRGIVGIGTSNPTQPGAALQVESGSITILRNGITSYAGNTTYHLEISNAGHTGTYGELALGVDSSGNSVIQSFGSRPILLNPTGNFVAIGAGKTTALATLDVLGTISGSALVINGSITNTGSLTTRGTVTFRSLTGCSTLQTNASGVLSCGPAAGFGSGNVLTLGDARYVSKQGDTMTGALVIQNGNSGTNTAAALLNVRGTMSGRSLWVSGSGSSAPLFRVDSTTGRVLVGTASGTDLMNIHGGRLAIVRPGVSVYGNQTSYHFSVTNYQQGGTYGELAIGVDTTGNALLQSYNGLPIIMQPSGNNVAISKTTAKAKLDVLGTISGSALVINGSITSTGALNVRGAITFRSLTGCTALQTDSNGLLSCGSGGSGTFGSGNVITIGNSRYVSKQGDTMTGALVIQNGNTHSYTGSPLLNVRGVISGASLVVSGQASITGSLTLGDGGNGKIGDLRLFTTGAGNYTRVYGAGSVRTEVDLVGAVNGIWNWSSDYTVGIGTVSPKATLDVVGSISGTTLYAATTINSSGSVFLEGTISGSVIRGFGLNDDCDNATTSKLLWDTSTGRFSCGIDQNAGAFGSGNVLTIGDSRYVSKQGDTMTGALVIQNGNTHSATATPLLNVRGTMSGRSLYISGSGSNPILVTSLARGRVGINTNSPKATLDVVGTISGASLNLNGNATMTGGALTIARDGAGTNMITLKRTDAGSAFTINGYSAAYGYSMAYGGVNVLAISNATINLGRNGSGAGDIEMTMLDRSGTDAAGRTLTISAGQGTGTGEGGALVFRTAPAGGTSGTSTNTMVEQFRITGNGLFGFRTSAPGAVMSISGATVISDRGNVVANRAAKATLDVVGSISGSSLYVANLNAANCDVKSVNGVLSCGTDATGSSTFGSGNVLTIGDNRYTRKAGDTMTGTLVIQNGNTHTPTAAPLLTVRGVMSGYRLVVSGNATITGSLLATGNITARDTLSGSVVHASTRLRSSGSLAVEGNANIDGLTFNLNATTDNVGFGIAAGTDTRMEVFTSSDSLGVDILNSTSNNDSAVYGVRSIVDGTTNSANIAGYFSAINSTVNYGLIVANGRTGLGTTAPGAAVSISGATVISDRGNVVANRAAKATLDVVGSISGSSLYVANLNAANCDVKSTNGVLSCGTDATGSSTFGSGNVITIGNSRYVSKQGDTMTGALVIQNGNTHTATATPLLNVRGTMSGRSLYISGTGSTPLFATNILTGRVGIGTSAPKATLDVIGTLSGAGLNINGSSTFRGVVNIYNTSTNTILAVGASGSEPAGYQTQFANRSITTVDVSDFSASALFLSPTGGSVSVNRATTATQHTALEVGGAISGSTLTLSGLRNCNTIDTNSAGVLICGTDEGGAGAVIGSGNVLTIGDARYVRKAGDTMTGTLVIQNGNTASPTATPLLTVRGTMSGRSLYISGTGSTPLFATNILTGRIGINTAKPVTTIDVRDGTLSLWRNGTGGLSLVNTVIGDARNVNLITQVSGSTLYDSVHVAIGSDRYGVRQEFIKARDDGLGGFTNPETDDSIAEFNFKAYNFGINTAASIKAVVDGFDTSIPSIPGRLEFHTTDGTGLGGGLLQRMRIDKYGNVRIGSGAAVTKLDVAGAISGASLVTNGNITPGRDNRFDLGTNTLRWRHLYLSGGTLNLGTATSSGAISYQSAGFEGLNFYGKASSSTPSMVISSGGLVGIGTAAPRTQLEVFGTISGSSIRISNTLSTSGSLMVQGAVTFRSLTGCSSLQTNGNGVLSCGSGGSSFGSGNVITIGNSRYVSKQGDTMTGALVIQNGNTHTTTAAPLLTVRGVMSGYRLVVSGNATITGSLLATGNITARGTLTGSNLTISRSASITGTLVVRGGITTKNMLSGRLLSVSGNANITGALLVRGNITSRGMLSGRLLSVSGNANITGALLVRGNITSRGTISGALVTQNGAGTNYFMGNLALGKTTVSSNTRLDVVGTISGSTLYASTNINSSGSIFLEGTISGAVIRGFGLNTDCDNATTSKLLWDTTTGRFSCGNDQSGGAGTFGSGNVITIGNSRYVSKQGDTMTGALVIQNGNTHTPTATPLLNVRGTMSGQNLIVWGTGSTPILSTRAGNAALGIGVLNPGETLDVAGNMRSTNFRNYGLTRTLPTTVNDEVAIGTFTTTLGAAMFEIDIVSPNGSFSMSKHYTIPVYYSATAGGWQTVIANSSTGPFSSNDYDLDINVNNASVSFRIRRTAGSQAGTMYVHVRQYGVNTDSFAPSTATSSVSAPATYYGSNQLTQVASLGFVGIGKIAPKALLDVQGTISGSTIISSGRIGVGTTNPRTPIEVKGVISGSTMVASFLGLGGNINPTVPLDVQGEIRTTNFRTQSVTRTVPTTVNDAVDIGTYTFTNGGGSIYIDVVVPAGSFSISKQYLVPAFYNGTSGWATLIPLTNSGPYSGNDFDVDINISGAGVSLRIRRTAGSTAGTAYVSMKQQGLNTDTFTASSGTSSVAAPTAYYGASLLTQNASTGFAGVGTISPKTKFEVVGVISGSQLKISGPIFSSGGGLIKGNFGVRGIISGSTLTISNNAGISGSLVVRGNSFFRGNLNATGTLIVDGAITLRSLISCTNGIQSDANGVLSCASGGGISQTTADARYVDIGGDTMTGALTIQNGNTHSATTTPLLNVRGTMSGKQLFITGSGGSTIPLISTSNGRIGIGTASPLSTFDVRVPLENGLIGWFAGDEGGGTYTFDKSVTAGSGKFLNGATVATGKNGRALSFDGNNDYVTLGANNRLSGQQVPVTITGWFKQSSTTGNRILYSAYQSAGSHQLWSMVRLESGVLTYYTSTANGSYQGAGSLTAAANQWHHFAIVVSGTTAAPRVTFYLDNKTQTANFSAVSATPDLTVPISIGANYAGGEPFAGLIDELRIYNRELNAREVAELARLTQLSLVGGTTFGELRIDSGASLNVSGLISGATLMVSGNSMMTGTLLARGNISTRGTLSGAALTIMNGNSYLLGSVAIGKTSVTTGNKFEVVGTISGSALRISGSISASGAVMLEGALSGATINGFGLGNDCDGTSNKITWDVTTQRFKCETDQTGGAAGLVDHYVLASGDTMTGTLVIQNGTTHSPTATPLLNVRGTMSGRHLRLSGTGASPVLMTDTKRVGIGTSSPAYTLDLVSTEDAPTVRFRSTSTVYGPQFLLDASGAGGREFRLVSTPSGNATIGSNKFAIYDTTGGAYRFMIDSSGYVGIGDNLATETERLTVAGAISVQGAAAGSTGLVFSDESGYKRIQSYDSELLSLNPVGNNVAVGKTSAAAKLDVLGIISGSILSISGNASFTGAVVIKGNNANKAALNVLGTASGSILYATQTIRSSGSIVLEGMLSGATISGFGLSTDCDGTSNKITWDATTSRFKCETDQSGASGLVDHYVLASGDTMTGALIIQSGNTAGNIGTPLLNVRGVMSGRTLYLSGSGAKAPALHIGKTGSGYAVTLSGSVVYQTAYGQPARMGAASVGNAAPTSVVTQGSYAYVGREVGSSAEFHVIDVINPASPRGVGTLELGVTVNDVKVQGRYAYLALASTYNGWNVLVVDVGNPATPVVIGGYANSAAVNKIFVSGKYLYGSFGTSPKLRALDISNPRDIALVGSCTFSKGIGDIYVRGSTLYTANTNAAGTHAIDISNPTILSGCEGGGGVINPSSTNIVVNGNYSFRIDVDSAGFPPPLNIRARDLANGTDYTLSITEPSESLSASLSLALAGRYLYVGTDATSNGDNFRIIDITNPQSMRHIASHNVGAGIGVRGIAIAGKYAYIVTDQTTGHNFRVLDLAGADFATASVGSLNAFEVLAQGNVKIGQNLSVGDAIQVGRGGIYSQGSLTVISNGTGSGLHALDVRSGSGSPMFIVTSSGTVAIGTGSALAQQAKMTIFTDNSFNQAALAIKSKETTATQNMFTITTDYNSTSNLVYRITASGATYADAPFNSAGADYAEWFPSDPNIKLKAGDAVCLDAAHENRVKRCDREGDPNLMGIVSTKPSFVGNAVAGTIIDKLGLPVPGYTLVGLIGQLDSTATTVGSGGVIKPGDSLTSSHVPGVLRRALPGESTVGVALTGVTDAEGPVRVLIARSNKSMTVEAVEERVRTSVAALKVDDEIRASLEAAISDSSFDERIESAVSAQLTALTPLEARVLTLEQTIHTLSGALNAPTLHPSPDAGEGTQGGGNWSSLTMTGSLQAGDVVSENSLTVGRDARISGDLYLEGALIMTGDVQLSGNVTTGKLTAASGSTINGTLNIAGDLLLNKNLTFQTGATITAPELIVSGAFFVRGPVTIDGLATFFGNVDIKGELTVNNRQAGFATIELGQKEVTVKFEPAFRFTPVVTATSNAFAPWRLKTSSMTGFTLEIQNAATEQIKFTWQALTVEAPMTASGASSSSDGAQTVFPIDEFGIPVSSSPIWNACIRHQQPMDPVTGQPFSCSRYTPDLYIWTHPDFPNMTFVWNDSYTPALLVLPDGYVRQTITTSSSSSSDSSASSESSSSDSSSSESSDSSSSDSSSSDSSASADSSDSSSSDSSSSDSSSSESSSSDSSSSESSSSDSSSSEGSSSSQ